MCFAHTFVLPISQQKASVRFQQLEHLSHPGSNFVAGKIRFLERKQCFFHRFRPTSALQRPRSCIPTSTAKWCEFFPSCFSPSSRAALSRTACGVAGRGMTPGNVASVATVMTGRVRGVRSVSRMFVAATKITSYRRRDKSCQVL